MIDLAEWFYTTNRQQAGPVSADQLRRLASRGDLQEQDLVWKEGMAEWLPATSVPGLFAPSRSSAPDMWRDDERDRPRPSRSYDADDNRPRGRFADDGDFARSERSRRYADVGDRDFLRRPRPKSKLALILTLVIGGVVLLVGLGIGAFALIVSSVNSTVALVPGQGPWDGELTGLESDDSGRPRHCCRVYTYPMTAGKTYTIDLQSDEFEGYLRLEDGNGVRLAFDDAAAAQNRGAQIVHVATRSGTFRIIVSTSETDETGPYQLRISP